jgi:putative transposase
VERLWRSVKHEDVYLKGYSAVGELLLGLTQYFSFYNVERPHQGLQNRTPDEVYQSGCGGGAMILDKYGAAEAIPIALRSTGTESEENPIEKESDTESQNPGQRRPAACEIESSLN